MRSPKYPKNRQNEIVIQELRDEILIYDLEVNKAYCLNKTSAMVYQLCDGEHSVTEMSRELTKKLKSPVTEDFVWLALNELKKENLLEDSGQFVERFKGVSRREAIRKVGLTSMIALPLITSLIAPTAAQAQSGAVNCTPAVAGPSGANFGGCRETSVAACQASCNDPVFGGARLVCQSCRANAVSCSAPVGGFVNCTCQCA